VAMKTKADTRYIKGEGKKRNLRKLSGMSDPGSFSDRDVEFPDSERTFSIFAAQLGGQRNYAPNRTFPRTDTEKRAGKTRAECKKPASHKGKTYGVSPLGGTGKHYAGRPGLPVTRSKGRTALGVFEKKNNRPDEGHGRQIGGPPSTSLQSIRRDTEGNECRKSARVAIIPTREDRGPRQIRERD